MSYCIEQTKDQTAEAFAVLKRTDLDEVRLVASSTVCRINRRFDRLGSCVFAIDFSSEHVQAQESEVGALTRFTFKMSEDDDESKPSLIEIVVSFEAAYTILEAGFAPTDSQLEAFRRGNAIFNCWPYFREYVHGTFARMGFPPPPVPFLRLIPKREDKPLVDSAKDARNQVAQ